MKCLEAVKGPVSVRRVDETDMMQRGGNISFFGLGEKSNLGGEKNCILATKEDLILYLGQFLLYEYILATPTPYATCFYESVSLAC